MNTHMTAVQQYIEGAQFPCTKDELIEHAQSRGATSDVIATLENLPSKEFASSSELMAHVGEGESLMADRDEEGI